MARVLRDMKVKLTPLVCYMAGLYSKSPRREKSLVCVSTGIEELRDRFIEIAVNELGIDPRRMIIDREDLSAGFYHSRVSKQLAGIVARETYVFKTVNDLSRNYLAGMFDISGHVTARGVEIRHVSARDALMLENLGVHTRGDAVLNISAFIGLVKGCSIVARRIAQE